MLCPSYRRNFSNYRRRRTFFKAFRASREEDEHIELLVKDARDTQREHIMPKLRTRGLP